MCVKCLVNFFPWGLWTSTGSYVTTVVIGSPCSLPNNNRHIRSDWVSTNLRLTCGNLSRIFYLSVVNRLNQKSLYSSKLYCNNLLFPSDEEPALQPHDLCHVEMGHSPYVTNRLKSTVNNLGPLYTRISRAFDLWFTNYVIGWEVGDGSSSFYTRPWWLEGPMKIRIDEDFTWRPPSHQVNIGSWYIKIRVRSNKKRQG